MADEKIFVEAVDGGAKNFFIYPQAAGRSGYHKALAAVYKDLFARFDS